MAQDNRKAKHTIWTTREDMVRRGMALSLPWFAFVNISFALMIFFRDALFHDTHARYLAEMRIVRTIDDAVIGIMLVCALLLITSRRQSWLTQGLLITLSLFWSWCSYYFISHWQLTFAYPLCAVLLLSAVIALYFHTPSVLVFLLPLWLTVPVASVVLNQKVNIHFAVIWGIFSLILLGGRFMLIRWFDEAWRQNQHNNLLISRLDNLAHRDPLTGTANRRAMEKLLHSATAQQNAFALIMLDVDFFKRYNDAYGHPAGDACLSQVADIFAQSVRSPEDVVARYGGEEFAVILFDATLQDAERVAARIQQALEAAAIPHPASTVSDSVTVSQGIACSEKGKTAEQTIADADAALYRAKEAGRNRWAR